MRISTRGRYGLRAMFELARAFGDGPLRMSAMAERQVLSRKHLHALLTSLKSAELVRSVRGPGGGFVLGRPPDQIRLSEVLRALEGPLSLVDCVENGRACNRVNRCSASRIWAEVSSAIENVLDNLTLQDMAALEGWDCTGTLGERKGPAPARRKNRRVKPAGAPSHATRPKARRR